jgi:hypothetical protein
MTDNRKISIEDILSRLLPVTRAQLRKLAASPEALALVGKEIERCVREREARQAREIAEIQAVETAKREVVQKVVDRFVGAVQAVSNQIAETNERLDRIALQDRQCTILAAMNQAAHWKGSLTFNPEKFKVAMAV